MRVANALGWNNPLIIPTLYFPLHPFSIYPFLFRSVSKGCFGSVSLGFRIAFQAFSSNALKFFRTFASLIFDIAWGVSPFTTLEGRFLKVLESLDGRKRSWRPQVLLRVEGRKSGIEYSSGGDGAAPCFIGGFYETFWQPFSKNVVHWQIELAICVGFHLIPFRIFFFLLLWHTKHFAAVACSSWQTNLNLY